MEGLEEEERRGRRGRDRSREAVTVTVAETFLPSFSNIVRLNCVGSTDNMVGGYGVPTGRTSKLSHVLPTRTPFSTT